MRMSRCTTVVVLIFTLLVLASLATGLNPPASNPQALSFAAHSIAAMAGSVSIRDVTLTGSVTWNGSDTGTATLEALGTGESRMDLALTGGTRTEIRDAQAGAPIGQWISPNNSSGKFVPHNCWTDAVWFFPALGSLAAGPNVVLSYIGQESRNGATVQHIQSYQYQTGQFPSPSPQQLSTMDFYLDANTFLPVALTFNAHPDNDANTNLLVEVDFSNYRAIGGVVVPLHIQKYQQGNLMIDVVVSGASFNTGLPLTIFAIN
jgi:hypothetical protein